MSKRVLEKIDLFSSPPFLYYNGNRKHSSALGIFLSLGIMVFLIYEFFHSEFFSKTSPYVIVETMQDNTIRSLTFNENNPFLLSVADPSTLQKLVDPTIFSFQAVYMDNYVPAIKEIEPCTKDDLPTIDEQTFDSLNASQLYCIKNSSFSLAGGADQLVLNLLEINLFPCNNSTSQVTCKSPEEINNFFKNKQMALGWLTSQFNSHNYQNPFTKGYQLGNNYVDPDFIKSNTLYLKTAQVVTDDGWFFANSNIESSITFDKNLQDFELRKNDTDPLVRWMIMASKDVVRCNRKYQRLPEVLGSLAGLIQSMIIVCLVFTSSDNHITALMQILNSLYYFEDTAENKKKTQKKPDKYSLQSKEMMSPTTQLDSPIIPVHTTALKKNQSDFKNEKKNEALDQNRINTEADENLNQKDNPLKDIEMGESKFPAESPTKEPIHKFTFSYFEYLSFVGKKLFCFKKSKREKLIDKAEKFYRNEIDIVNIVNKLHELDNLELLIFNEDLKILFDHITKPVITCQTDSKSTHRRTLLDSTFNIGEGNRKCDSRKREENKKQIIEAFKRCEGDMTCKLNKKLVEFCDKKWLN